MAGVVNEIAAVVIGRNEGERLRLSLASVQEAGLRCVYVDSGSSDGSPANARDLGIVTVELDPSRPFSAARGRNEGLKELQRRWPATKYVLFLDGDCVLNPAFPAVASRTLDERDRCAVVVGNLAERDPDASVYNRLCAIEWRSPAGPIENMRIGGIMAARIEAFCDVGGFDDQMVAGEEPDLAVRLAKAGYALYRVDAPMAIHDAQIFRFGQWWTRAVRGGHGIAQHFDRHRHTAAQLGLREIRSTVLWGFALPVLILALLWPSNGFSLILLGGYGVLGGRVFRHYLRAGLSRSDAFLMSRFIVLGKFAELVGVIRYCANRLRGKFNIIEYK